MTDVLVTGADGQLGTALGIAAADFEDVVVHGFGRDRLDVTDRGAVVDLVRRLRPDVIVNAAAFAATDAAEAALERAFAVNATAVEHLAAAANEVGAVLAQISTDYVFDGAKSGWYVEDDPAGPLNTYGASKVAGEVAARSAERHLILRTSWLYSEHSACFPRTMRTLARRGEPITVVDDQVGCPTAAADVATAILDVCRSDPPTGTFHVAGAEEASWFEFATAVLADEIAGGLVVTPITSAAYGAAATRPPNSRLDSSAWRQVTGSAPRGWRAALPGVLHSLTIERDVA